MHYPGSPNAQIRRLVRILWEMRKRTHEQLRVLFPRRRRIKSEDYWSEARISTVLIDPGCLLDLNLADQLSYQLNILPATVDSFKLDSSSKRSVQQERRKQQPKTDAETPLLKNWRTLQYTSTIIQEYIIQNVECTGSSVHPQHQGSNLMRCTRTHEDTRGVWLAYWPR